MRKLGIVKEDIDEPRLCVTPETVKKLTNILGVEVWVENGIGFGLGLDDGKFTEAGAKVVSRDSVIEESDLLSFINPFYQGESYLKKKVMVGMMNPLNSTNSFDLYMDQPISLYSMDLMPRISKAQSMDVLSSMSSVAGYKAVIKAAELYGSVFPMMTTAAGTLRPAKVLVLGAGVAGLQAIATARRLGAIVEAFDVRRAAAEQVKSLGAKFIELEGASEDEKAGGYAIEQSEEYKQRQEDLLSEKIRLANIIIATASIPGKRAPILISEDNVKSMASGSVIVDLASANGGNCQLTEHGRLTMHNNVLVLGGAYLSKQMAYASTQMLAANYYSFLEHVIKNHENGEDEIIKACRMIEDGKPTHVMFSTN